MDYNKAPNNDKLKSSMDHIKVSPAIAPTVKPVTMQVPLKVKSRQDYLK